VNIIVVTPFAKQHDILAARIAKQAQKLGRSLVPNKTVCAPIEKSYKRGVEAQKVYTKLTLFVNPRVRSSSTGFNYSMLITEISVVWCYI
jgi:CTP:molybdopterin cytidylyltransferase MocA